MHHDFSIKIMEIDLRPLLSASALSLFGGGDKVLSIHDDCTALVWEYGTQYVFGIEALSVFVAGSSLVTHHMLGD